MERITVITMAQSDQASDQAMLMTRSMRQKGTPSDQDRLMIRTNMVTTIMAITMVQGDQASDQGMPTLMTRVTAMARHQACGRLSLHQEVVRPSQFPFLEEGMLEAAVVLIHHAVDTDPQLQHHLHLLSGRRLL